MTTQTERRKKLSPIPTDPAEEAHAAIRTAAQNELAKQYRSLIESSITNVTPHYALQLLEDLRSGKARLTIERDRDGETQENPARHGLGLGDGNDAG
jgi:hypothetical protein